MNYQINEGGNDQRILESENGIDELISYQLLVNHLKDELNNNTSIKLKKIRNYINDFNTQFNVKLCTRSQVVRELYILHQTAKSLDRYNDEVLKLSYSQFRAIIYYPNIIYLLVRLLPNAKKFIQLKIRKVYQEFNNKAKSLVVLHINSLYIDQDSIKTDILNSFLGSGIKKFNPLNIGNIKSFYRVCFRNIFQFYFRRRKSLQDQEMIDFEMFDANVYQLSRVSSRHSIYKDVLYDIHVNKTQKKHMILSQLSYNFQIFKNIIVTNEFQSIYQNKKSTELASRDNKYQLIDFFDDDIFLKDPDLFRSLRQLPLIYKLLRCAHLQTPNVIPYNNFLIKPANVLFVIQEELSKPFKNFFVDSYVKDILDQIAKNFVKNILSGEYINLITFTTVKINHISFIDQLRKFVRLCLER